MPELPEVETIRCGLERMVIGLKLSNVVVLLQKSLVGDLSAIIGTSITSVKRRGKLLIIGTSGPYSILIHLKMTGQLILAPDGTDSQFPDKSTKVIFDFETGERLFFNDYRTFGYIHIHETDNLNEHQFIKKVGIEPFDPQFTFDYFCALVQKYPSLNVKVFLLDQTKIAGLGNIYTDEAFFLAGVLPTRALRSLSYDDQKDLYHSILEVLSQGIALKGSSKTSYRTLDGGKGTFLLSANVYGRGGMPCLKCGNAISKISFKGRGTHFCSYCQS